MDQSLGTTSYTYDDHGHLESYTPAVPANYGKISYEWTATGQKKSMTVPLGCEDKGRKFEYRYDRTGKQIGMDVTLVENIPGGSETSYVPESSGNQTLFTYDDNKNRVKLVNKLGQPYYFVYDPTASIPAVVYEQGLDQGNPAVFSRYVNIREPDGALVSREKYINDARIGSYTYHFDGLGSTRSITNEYGTVVDTYDYDAWGNEKGLYIHLADNPYRYVGKYGYYTHYQEPDFALLATGVRYYDPSVGRFTQRGSPYTYAGDNPVNSGSSGASIIPGIDTRKPPRWFVFPKKPSRLGRILPIIERRLIGPIVGVFVCSIGPVGITPEQLRAGCNDKAADCLEQVDDIASRYKLSGGQKKFLQDECYYCQTDCINRANAHIEVNTWPTGSDFDGRCNFLEWPRKHPRWPVPK